jgi:HAD superfamily hydrolase (TIGR01490 family)
MLKCSAPLWLCGYFYAGRLILKTIAALFDVDGTLFTGHVWRGMLDYFEMQRGKWAVRRFWYAHLPSYFLRKLKLISEEQFRGPWGAHLAWLVKGWDGAQLQGLYDYIAHEHTAAHRREDTIEMLQDHRAQGHVTLLVSTGFTEMVAEIGKTIGAELAVGCDLEMKDGRATGRIIPPIVIGKQKGIAAKAKLAALGHDVDYASSFAYADSMTDLGMFEIVGNPRPVYPKADLAAYAKQQGWPVYGAPDDGHGQG